MKNRIVSLLAMFCVLALIGCENNPEPQATESDTPLNTETQTDVPSNTETQIEVSSDTDSVFEPQATESDTPLSTETQTDVPSNTDSVFEPQATESDTPLSTETQTDVPSNTETQTDVPSNTETQIEVSSDTDLDSTPDNETHDHVPHDSMLNLEIIDGKFRFQRIATTPCIVYANTPITDMSKGTQYDDRHDILTAIFRATDGKDAIMDTTECDFLHYIYVFDNENEDASWHYRFAICNCGAVRITNNNELLCSIEISDDELQTILGSFDTSEESANNAATECEHNWQVVSRNSGCWYISESYVCSECNIEQFADGEFVLPNHSWSEKTAEGKTTFSCTRCKESYTFISETREFSYAQALEYYKIGDPGVKHENFNNPAVESEITGAIDAIIRAEFELTIEYDTISVSYDETSNVWRVDFWTLNLDGNSQSVYINGDGLTCYIVYGE